MSEQLRVKTANCGGKVRTITISERKGITALLSVIGGTSKICSYLFDPSSWTLQTAREWVDEHALKSEYLHNDFIKIRDRYFRGGDLGELEGYEKFLQFIHKNQLDPALPYDPRSQFMESFEWIAPEIQFMREDHDAKYYQVVVLSASVSMNNNDYSQFNELELASPSMSFRPLNLNHSDRHWLPYPRNRTEFGVFNRGVLETVVRIDNKERPIQRKIENEEIIHVSLEARKNPPNIGGFHFTALSLLEVGKELAGFPNSSIEPLILNESLHPDIYDLVENRVNLTPAIVQSYKDRLQKERELVHSLWLMLNKKGVKAKVNNKLYDGDPRKILGYD
jgi:hypothetical protein